MIRRHDPFRVALLVIFASAGFASGPSSMLTRAREKEDLRLGGGGSLDASSKSYRLGNHPWASPFRSTTDALDCFDVLFLKKMVQWSQKWKMIANHRTSFSMILMG